MIYSIQDTTLTAIGDALRSKYGETRPVETEYAVFNYRINSFDEDIVGTGLGVEQKEARLVWPTETAYIIAKCKYNSYAGYAIFSINGQNYWGTNTLEEIRVEGNIISLECGNVTPYAATGCYCEIRGYDADGNLVLYPSPIETEFNGYKPEDMADAVDILVKPPENIVLSGDMMYGCSGALSSKFIDLFGNSITTDRIQNTNYMFFKCENENIPFDINIQQLTDDYYFSMSSMFEACYSLIELPKIPYARPQGMSRLFYDCYNLKNIPEDYFDNWDFYEIKNYNYAYVQYMFYNCHSLRNIPSQILGSWNGGLQNSSAYTPYYFGFYGCYVLDAINNLGVIQPSSLTANSFASSFSNCSRIKSLTFKLQDNNIPQTANWKHQNLALNEYVGYAYSRDYITQYSGLTTETQIVDDITYQALKDHPDSWTLLKDYSRYNHDSAVETINSLPDCSAYLATQTSGVNTIKFLGASGAKTDGGAINTLTEEEIAVATAKGWTVSLV